jgi:hypothetical protein
MPDPTYNLNGGFKPTIKRFADLGGPDFFPTPRWADIRSDRQREVQRRHLGVRVWRRHHVEGAGRNRLRGPQLRSL